MNEEQERPALIDFSIERERHARFVGRQDVLAQLDAWLLRSEEAGWVVVTGGPGMGKSAVLSAWMTQREASGVVVPHHFVRRQVADWDQPTAIAASLSSQLEVLFPDLCYADSKPERRLIELLGRVSKRVGSGRGIVLLVDGLDETYAEQGDNPLPLFLPHHLPRGIRMLCATRPTYPHLNWIEARNLIGRIDLDERTWAASNRSVVRKFWEVVNPEYSPPLSATMKAAAIERAEGNVLHAVMLHLLLRRLPAMDRRVDRLPRGIRALFDELWNQASSQRPSVRAGLGLLCAAQEALPLDVLAETAGWSYDERASFLPAVRPLLLEEVTSWAGTEAYRPRHEWVRELIVEQLGTAAIRAHHRTLAQKLATWPAPRDAARRYALRHALGHRVAAGEWKEAWRLVSDLSFLEATCREIGAHEIELEIVRAAENSRAQGDDLLRRNFENVARALSRESHWLRVVPEETVALIWNQLRQMGWSTHDLNKRLQIPIGSQFLRLRHLATRESPALERSLVGHMHGVTACAMTPDGSRLVSASHDRTLKVWDFHSGRSLATLRGHSDLVNACAVTPNGRRVVSASDDKTLKVWAIRSGNLLATLQGHDDWVNACVVAPDGRHIISGSDDQTLKLWDLHSQRALVTFRGHSAGITACAVTLDGHRIVSASDDQTLTAWDLSSGRALVTFRGHSAGVTACAITSDGLRVVSASDDQTLRIWDLFSGEMLTTLQGHSDCVTACAVTLNNRYVVSASDDQSLKVWALPSGELQATFQGHAGWVNACLVTPDSQRVVSASDDQTLKVWDLNWERSTSPHRGHDDAVAALTITPNGQRVVSASWDRTLKVWDLHSGRSITSFHGHDDGLTACTVTPDGRRIVSASWDQTLKLWDLHSGRYLATLQGHSSEMTACAVTPDGYRVVSASDDRTLKVWDLRAARHLSTLRGHSGRVTGCTVTPDGHRIVSASNDQTLRVWDLRSGRTLSILHGHAGRVTACAVASDNRSIVSCSEDKTLKIWDSRSGELLATFRGHTSEVTACAVTPDSRYIVSVSWDQTLKVWNIASGECMFTHRASAGYLSVATTASTTIAGDINGAIWFFDWPSSNCWSDSNTPQLVPAAAPKEATNLAGATKSTHEVFVIHANSPAENAFVRSELVPALCLTPDKILLSSELPLGQTVIGALERGAISSRITVVVLSPNLLRDTWASFGETIASYIAVAGGTLVPLILDDIELPPHLSLRIQLDCRDPRARPYALSRLRALISRDHQLH